MEPNPQIEEARENLHILNLARAFGELIETAGWKEIYKLQCSWLEKARFEMRRMPTGDNQAALDALRRWQLAEDMVELQVKFINDTLARAEEIRGGLGIDDALLMEKLRNEQPQSAGDPSAGVDRAGY